MRIRKREGVWLKRDWTGRLLLLLAFVGIIAVPVIGDDTTAWLTAEERVWIAAHPVITVAPDPDFPPIEYFDEGGEYQGLAADYLALVEQKTGLNFKIVRCASWDEVLAKARAREVDALPAAAQTPQRADYLLFSDPHIVLQGVIIARQQVKGTLTVDDLQGMRVAVVRGYAWQEFITSEHPKIELDLVNDLQTGLRKVSLGMADVVIATLPVAIYHIEKEGITNLHVAGETGYFISLSFATRSDWPQLHTIMQGALAGIPQEEKDAILSRWIRLERKPMIAGKTLWIIIAVVLGGIGLGALVAVQWTLSMKRQVARKTADLNYELSVRRQTEEDLSASEERHRVLFAQLSDALFVETLEGRILNVNESACKLLGYTREELTQMTVRDLLPPGTPEFLPQEIIAATIHENIIETANKRKDGSIVPVELRGRVVNIDDQPRLLVSLRDITERVRLGKIQSVLHQIAETVNLTVDLDALFPAIRRILGTLLDTTNFRITLYDRESDTIFMPYMVDEQDTYHSFVAGKTSTAYVIKENKSLLLTQENRDEFIRSAGLEPVGHAAKVWLGVPLRVEEGVIGALVVQSYTNLSLYTGDEVKILELVADQVSVAITRKQDEEILREREEQYRSIFESTTDAVLIFNLDEEIVAANPIAYSLYGYGKGELIGLSAEKLVRPDYFHGFKNFRKRVEDGGRFEVDSVNLRKDGTEFDIAMHGAGFAYQGKPHLLSVVRDITARKQAEERLKKSSQKIVRLHEVAQYLESCKDEDEAYRATVEAAEKILDFTLASLDIVEGDKLVVKATSAELPSGASRESSLSNGGLAAKTYRTRKTIIFGSMDDVPEAAPTREEFRSGISAPIGDIGVFQVVSTHVNAFTDEDARMLELLLGHTIEAVKRIRLQAKLREQAMRDPLTGIYNRRYFNQVVEQEINRSKRYKHSIAFLMIDINRFKEINDRFGHQIGDSVLQQVASLLLQEVREADIVVRYGGDEFLIVLPETNGEADVVLQRIHCAVGKRNETNELIPFPVTLAIGSAHWEPDRDRTVAQVLAEADQKMYEEKQRALT